MTIKCALFDWDNTIVNTAKFKELSRNAIIIGIQTEATQKFELKLSRKILEETIEKIRKEKGSNYSKLIDESVASVLKKMNIDDQLKIDRIATAGISAHHKIKAAYFSFLFDEVIETLTALKKKGLVIGIATAGLTHKQIDKVNWANLNQLIDEIFVTEQYITEKLKGEEQKLPLEIKTPEYFKWIAEKLRIPTESIIMTGDSYHNDIEPAKKAGLVTAHLVRECNGEEIKGTMADYLIMDLSAIIKIISEINFEKH